MNHYVTDPHALYWYFINSPQLGARASAAFDEADQGRAIIYIPAIVIAELYYLNKKYGFRLDLSPVITELRQRTQFELLPFFAEDVLDFDANAAVPEMHDRMIVGDALRHNAPCLTRDGQIVKSGLVPIVW
ncbi:MAG TPA: hypothetical protein PLD20_23815 [Blastocatellia bacterium]|nr:hypothetical protein [Blastocatellia bacterium]HMV87768.1 hypothetical protein [Blastocatellia bacterium]HMX28429.1 hypothetical protein [Blastocatellia bacterium]HMY72057.1 hypothetical protein [Blastocatellia bacterium]HMZ20981.1 hypothetical protein [Blastocatellia bacterium]